MATVSKMRGKRSGSSKQPTKRAGSQTSKTVVVTVSASDARGEFSNWISEVKYGHKWLVLERHGKAAVAMVPVADLKVLRDLEDKIDLEAAREALSEAGESSWEAVKAKLGL